MPDVLAMVQIDVERKRRKNGEFRGSLFWRSEECFDNEERWAVCSHFCSKLCTKCESSKIAFSNTQVNICIAGTCIWTQQTSLSTQHTRPTQFCLPDL